MTQSDQVVLVDTVNGVRTLTLNRPEKLNAANNALIWGLTEALRDADQDDAIRVVVITAAGRGFCAGQDLTDVTPQEGEEMDFTRHIQTTYNPLIRTLRGLSKPVITAVNGIAAGAGASLGLAGDIRVWARSAAMTQVFSNIALVPDTGSTWFLPRLVGYHRAFELMAFAEKVTAEDALKLGLCEHVFPDETFRDDVQAYAERLAARPAHALKLTKQALTHALGSTLDSALDLESVLQQQAAQSWEHQEGMAAFSEKRKPNFVK